MLKTKFLTVFSARLSSSPISRFVSPSATSERKRSSWGDSRTSFSSFHQVFASEQPLQDRVRDRETQQAPALADRADPANELAARERA
jgi:hypothetical protein